MALNSTQGKAIHSDGNQTEVKVSDLDTRLLLEDILVQLTKMNQHLAIMSEYELDNDDIKNDLRGL